MMKETKLSPLLICLMVTITPRENSATPIASPAFFSPSPAVFPRRAAGGTVAGAPANIPSVIVNNMAEGADLLTETFIWLQNNMLTSQFEKSVSELETEISELPFELPANRFDVLEGIYIAQDRINLIRNTLTLAAKELKGYCEELIYIYNNNKITKRLLTWSSNRFLEYAKRVKYTLDLAKNETKEVQDSLSKTKVFLFKLNSILKQKAVGETQNITIRMGCTTTSQLRYSCDVRLVIKDKGIDLEPALNAAGVLDFHVDFVKQYLTKDLDLIINWKVRLAASISDLENISLANIQFSMKGIKDRLGVLVNACEEYINHKLPWVLLKGRPSNTPANRGISDFKKCCGV